MKSKFLLCLLLCAFTGKLSAQLTYQNDGILAAPPDFIPVVDAQNFVNGGQFIINLTNSDLTVQDVYAPALLPEFTTQNTLTYSNLFGGLMAANTGFKFDLFSPSSPFPTKEGRASVFFNEGEIHSGTLDTSNYLVFQATAFLNTVFYSFATIAGSRLSISATNVINHGIIDMGFDSLLKIDGDGVDLSYSTIQADTTGFGFSTNLFVLFFNNSIFDGYWGTGDPFTQRPVFYPNGINPRGFFSSAFPRTPIHDVNTRAGTVIPQSFGDSSYTSYILDEDDSLASSNRFVRIVYLNVTNENLTANVYFPDTAQIGGPIILEFTNNASADGLNLYVEDDFGIVTNKNLFVNNIAGYRLPTQIPAAYSLFEANPTIFNFNFGTPATPADVPASTFFPGNVTNDWQAYEAVFRPVSYVLEDIVHREWSNGPGRMEISSDTLDLANSAITSQNYMRISATNQYLGNSNAVILSPICDLNLRNTNGTFVISNLVNPRVLRLEGYLDLFSARWTNVVLGITNRYHVLFANAQFSPFSPVRSQDLVLHSTNGLGGPDQIILSDVLTVTKNLLIDTERLTTTTNDSTAVSPIGGINVVSNGIVWPSSFPRLQFLTNNGALQAINTMFFGGVRSSPYYVSNFTEPYQVFINSGSVSNFSTKIQANLFINSGSVFAWNGAVSLDGQTGILTNGSFITISNNIGITEGALVISNHVLSAGGAIFLSATSLLDDGSLNPIGVDSADFVTNRNFWACSGFNLLRVPVGNASLLGTTITNSALPNHNIINRSAAANLGCSAAGFNKNGAIGRLVLDGGNQSQFTFQGVGGNNALYVDTIELRDFTTNFVNNVFKGLGVTPGMHVYFANAIVQNGANISEKLNGANNGAFCWIRDYNCGPYSSTNMVYPDGTTNRLNLGVVQSQNLDSDNDGTVNYLDSSPVPPTANTCTPAPFPPAIIPIPAIVVSSGNGGGSGGGSGSDSSHVGGHGKLGFPSPSGTNNGSTILVKGTFSGLFSDQSNGVATANSGYFTASTTPAGTFSTKIVMNGKTYSASGKFNSEGKATVKYARGGFKALTAILQLDSTGSEITGTITDGSWTAQLMAERLVFTKKGNTAGSFSGAYTLRIPALDGFGPAGDGFGTVTVDSGGGIKFSGSLADGSKVAQKTSLSEQGIWPLYSSLYKGAGSLIGWLQVTNAGGIGGEVIWLKSGAFTNDVQATGERYQKPSGHGKVLDLSACQLILNGDGVSIADNNLTLGDNNKLSDAASKLQLNLIPSSGLLKGHILNPDSGKLIQFQGAVFQDSKIGFGYFLNSNQSGQVLLQAAP